MRSGGRNGSRGCGKCVACSVCSPMFINFVIASFFKSDKSKILYRFPSIDVDDGGDDGGDGGDGSGGDGGDGNSNGDGVDGYPNLFFRKPQAKVIPQQPNISAPHPELALVASIYLY